MDKPRQCPKPDDDSCLDQTPCGVCPKAWCEWAGCHRRMRVIADGWAMCKPHHRLHVELLAEAANATHITTCAGCAQTFSCTDSRRTRCDSCRRVRIDKRPTHAKRQKAA